MDRMKGDGRENEIKYLVNPQKFPDDLKQALQKGTQHKDIIRKGRITQIYLPFDREKPQEIHRKIHEMVLAAIKGSPDKSSAVCINDPYFADMENVGELRILQREQDHLPNEDDKDDKKEDPVKKGYKKLTHPDAFQITIKGEKDDKTGSRRRIETPITIDMQVARAVAEILKSLRVDGRPMSWLPRVRIVEKMWYDIKHYDVNGEKHKVELDVFPDLDYLQVGEIEFKTVREMNEFKADEKNLPGWFERDISKNPSFRVKNLAGKTVDQLDPTVRAHIRRMKYKELPFHQPTFLGNEIDILQDIEDKNFVVVGSFMQWIPQFRRIVQDLRRRCRRVFPDITTYDVAHRQAIDYDEKVENFRIEAVEEKKKLEDAEIVYLEEIRKTNAVYLVTPEGKAGETSSQESLYAISLKKDVFVTENVRNVSASLPKGQRYLFQCAIKAVLEGLHEDRLKKGLSITPLMELFGDRVLTGKNEKESVAFGNKRHILRSARRVDRNNETPEEKKKREAYRVGRRVYWEAVAQHSLQLNKKQRKREFMPRLKELFPDAEEYLKKVEAEERKKKLQGSKVP